MRRISKIVAFLLAICLCVQMTPGISAEETRTDALFESFETPSDDQKPAPLWFWNTQIKDMTTDEVREIVRESYLQTGYSGFGILPNWLEDYLNDDYFEMYEAALDEGSKYGMKFSLYDENGFPSYNAGGLLEEQYPDLTTKRLDKYEADGANGEQVRLNLPDGTFMGAVAMNTDTKERVDISEYATILPPKPYDPYEEPLGISASSTYTVSPGYEADKAVDGDLSTRWNSETRSGGNQYLLINFGEKKTFDEIKVYEDKDPQLHRTSKYIIQYWDDQAAAWQEIANGKKITDAGVDHTFDDVTSQFVRLQIKRVTNDSASISEFQVFCEGQQLEVPPKEEDPSVEDGEFYTASSFYGEGYEADKAFDGDFTTRWNAGDYVPNPHWLQMAFGEVRSVDSVKIYEHIGRITSYEVQYWEDGDWKTAATGTAIGEQGVTLDFDPVETSRIRLYIKDTSDYCPTIWEIEAYDQGEKIQPKQPEEEPYDGSYLEYTVPEGNWKVMAFMCVVDGNNGMDYLDPDSVRAFIDITYEAYYQRFKKYFDNGTITTAFFDEPSFWPAGGRTPYGAQGARLWTPGFNEEYEKIYEGESPVLNYPALWYDIGEDTDEARNKLQYVRTELFATSYIGQLNQWCEDHGIELTGHMLFEEWTNPVGLHGDLMKVFKEQAIPGVDVIDYVGKSQEAYKIISSSAYNWDKGKVMSESFGVFPSKDCTDFYRSAMDQYAKGINLIVPHAVWYDDDPANVTYQPELSYRNPLFSEDLPQFNTYMARLNTMLQDGRHVADIAMLYPIDYLESCFIFNEKENNPGDADYMRVGETLSLTARRDFTYLHPDVIDEKCSVEGDTFNLSNEVNYEQFKVFVIPGTKVISLSNLQKIKEFYDNGGKVIATTQLPSRGIEASENEEVCRIIEEMFGVSPDANQDAQNSNEKGGQAYFIKSGFETKLSQVLDEVLPVYDVELDAGAVSGGNLSYIHKVKDERNIYYFANSSNTPVDTTVRIRGELKSPAVWDPSTGTETPADYKIVTQDGQKVTEVKLKLDAVESLFVVESKPSEPVETVVTTDKDTYEVNETITVTVETDIQTEGITFYNENGRYLGISRIKSMIQGDKKIWTLQTSVGTQGNRTIQVKARKDGMWIDLAQFNVAVTVPYAPEAAVYEAHIQTDQAAAGQWFTVQIWTDQNTEGIVVRSETGRYIDSPAGQYEDRGDRRLFTISISVGTAGFRVLSFHGVNSQGKVSADSVEDSVIITG